jgi:hypothetical protein
LYVNLLILSQLHFYGYEVFLILVLCVEILMVIWVCIPCSIKAFLWHFRRTNFHPLLKSSNFHWIETHHILLALVGWTGLLCLLYRCSSLRVLFSHYSVISCTAQYILCYRNVVIVYVMERWNNHQSICCNNEIGILDLVYWKFIFEVNVVTL